MILGLPDNPTPEEIAAQRSADDAIDKVFGRSRFADISVDEELDR